MVYGTQGGLRRGGLTPGLAPRIPVVPRMYDMIRIIGNQIETENATYYQGVH